MRYSIPESSTAIPDIGMIGTEESVDLASNFDLSYGAESRSDRVAVQYGL